MKQKGNANFEKEACINEYVARKVCNQLQRFVHSNLVVK